MTAKLTRAVRCTAAVLAVIAVGAGATACDSSSGSTSSKAGGWSGLQGGSQEKAQAAGDSMKNVKKMAEKGSRTDAVNLASTASTASTTGAESKRCHTGELTFNWGGPHGGAPDMQADYQQMATVRLANSGNRTCTLHGFPGVRLISTTGETWDLPRSSDKPSTMTLSPGDDTSMVSMNILPLPNAMKGPKPFKVSQVLITPPDETTHVTLKWPYGGAVLDQSGATRPGTFVNPIGIG
ncbi:DUF4232 domain-containing protein [Streptomyces sp. NBC_00963]|uniref:DUF4232 domain-containing protein n=1 Tax=Streptomyces sp. NBC_00963 TaxID=2903697 RepID=UPI00386F3F87|nr:DUF4232 domain-containing protein [Streptomyces sp. NBC_00963]